MSTLAAARADNFYYPPEWTPDQGGLNKFQGQHPLRERAKKIDQGILVIRFEMPFNIWCDHCGTMIAKGVRFNAEKQAVGKYLSTKIWSFKMKTACCQHEIEIQTDPKNCDYIVVSGGTKKVEEYDPDDAGTVAFPEQAERDKLDDAFFKLEHDGEDVAKMKAGAPRMAQLKAAMDTRHADPYSLNRALRSELRSQKKRVAEEEADARSRGLAIRLLPKSDEDRAAAARATFHPHFDTNLRNKRAAIQAASIFGGSPSSNPKGGSGWARPHKRQTGGGGALSSKLSEEKRLELLAKRRRINPAGALVLLGGAVAPAKKSDIRRNAAASRSMNVQVKQLS